MESVLNQVLEAQMTEHLGADRHERTEELTGYRSGVRGTGFDDADGNIDSSGFANPGRKFHHRSLQALPTI